MKTALTQGMHKRLIVSIYLFAYVETWHQKLSRTTIKENRLIRWIVCFILYVWRRRAQNEGARIQNEGARIQNRLELVYYRFTSSRILDEQKH
jgi:hypothetical protein